MSVKTLIKAMRILTINYSNFDLSEQKIELYRQTLGDLSEDQIRLAIKTFCLAHAEIYPGTNIIAKLRSYAMGHHLREGATEAWDIVLRGAKGQRVEIKNPITDRVVKAMGGFTTLGMSENIIADRAHFIRMYEDEVEKQNFRELAGSNE